MSHQKNGILDMLHSHWFYLLTDYNPINQDTFLMWGQFPEGSFTVFIVVHLFFFALFQSKVIFIKLRWHHFQKPLQWRRNSLPQSVETPPCILRSLKFASEESKTEMITYGLVTSGRFLFYCSLLALFHLLLQPWFHKLYLVPGCSKQPLLEDGKKHIYVYG